MLKVSERYRGHRLQRDILCQTRGYKSLDISLTGFEEFEIDLQVIFINWDFDFEPFSPDSDRAVKMYAIKVSGSVFGPLIVLNNLWYLKKSRHELFT